MGTRTWTADYNGQRIVVTSHFRWFPLKTWECLRIGEQPEIRQDGSVLRMADTLFGEVQTPSGVGLLEVRLGQRVGGFRLGCHILVDGKLIGGDVDAKLNYPDPQHWEAVRKAGFLRFLALRGVGAMGLPFGLFMMLSDRSASGLVRLASFAFHAVFFGTFMGYLLWRSGETQYARHQQARARLRGSSASPVGALEPPALRARTVMIPLLLLPVLGLIAVNVRDAPPPWYVPDPPEVRGPRPARIALSETLPFVGEAGEDAFGYPLRKPDMAVLLEALRARRFDLLERWMTFLQGEFERDYRNESWPDTMVSAFFVVDPELAKPLDEWVARSPEHFAPWAARGSYAFALAGYYRGDKFIRQTSWAQRSKMRELHRSAAKDFARALALEPQLVAAHRRLLQIEETEPDLGPRGWLDAGVEQCRLCYYLRATYMNQITPRWGGSTQMMNDYIREVQPLVRENPKLGLLAGAVAWDRCRTLRETGDREGARRACESALEYGDERNALLERTYLHSATKEPQQVLPFLDRVLRLYPQDRAALARRFLARAQERASHLGAAQDLLAVRRVDPTNKVAADNLIWMLNRLLRDGDEFAAAGKHDEALAYYEIGLQLGPGDRLLTEHAAASREAITAAR